MKMRSINAWFAAMFVLAGAATLTGCDDDDSSDTVEVDAGGSVDDDSGVVDNDAGTEPLPSVYGVVTVQRSGGGAPPTSFLILSDNLTDSFAFEDAVLEIPGVAAAAAPVGGGQVFVGLSTAEVVRYDLVDGDLQESGRLSLAAEQATSGGAYGAHYRFISDTKAYFIADDRVIIWNPKDMVTMGSIVVPEMLREDPENPGTNYTTAATGNPLHIGDMIYVFIAWDSRTAGIIKVPGASGILAINTTTDTAEFYIDEAGCGYGREAVQEGDWLYVVTESVGTAVNYLDAENGPKPCIRRFNINTNTYDDDYTIDLNELAGSAAGSLATTASGQALIHVLDEETIAPLIADGSVANARSFASAVAWKTARLTLGDTPSVTVLDTPLRSASVLQASLADDLVVTPSYGQDQMLVEVTEDGIIQTERTGASLGGTTFSVFQIQ